LRAHGELTGGESGLEQLRESAALLAGASAVEHARSLLALGQATPGPVVQTVACCSRRPWGRSPASPECRCRG
jgi:hypothetical protein